MAKLIEVKIEGKVYKIRESDKKKATMLIASLAKKAVSHGPQDNTK